MARHIKQFKFLKVVDTKVDGEPCKLLYAIIDGEVEIDDESKKHPFSRILRQNRNLLLEEHCKCDVCGNLEKLEMHHKDFTHYNHEMKNLQLLCRSCHRKTHWWYDEGYREHAYDYRK